MQTTPSSPQDIEYLVSWIADKTACRMWAGPLVHFPLKLTKLLEEIGYTPDNSFCLRHNGSIKAFGQLLPKQANSLHMARIIVAPESRGLGFGRKICTDLIQIARERKAGSLSLNVYRDNTIGVCLYRRLGFAEIQAKSTAEYLHMHKHMSSAYPKVVMPGI
jgi:ribosomal protein S18 acetylase RimI-like enzyme